MTTAPATALHVVGTRQATAVIADGQQLRVDKLLQRMAMMLSDARAK